MRDPRGSSSPPRSTATLNDWQGVPPTRTSISWSGHSLNLVMSPWFGTLGYRVASTALGNGSISEVKAARKPSGSQATEAASIPLHTDPKITLSPFDTGRAENAAAHDRRRRHTWSHRQRRQADPRRLGVRQPHDQERK